MNELRADTKRVDDIDWNQFWKEWEEWNKPIEIKIEVEVVALGR